MGFNARLGIFAAAMMASGCGHPLPAALHGTAAAAPSGIAPSPTGSATISLTPSTRATATLSPPRPSTPTPTPCPSATGWASTATPAPRVGAVMAYDPHLAKLLLFSGVPGDGSAPFQDMWSWDGATWSPLHPATLPPGRGFGAMAYDEAHQGLLLYGGGDSHNCGDSYRTDTWFWDGTTWSLRQPSASLPSQVSMTYDAAIGTSVLLGGAPRIWDGNTWVDRHVAQELRGNAFIVYDAATSNVVALDLPDTGLYDASKPTTTWTFNGIEWYQLHPAPQPLADWAVGAFDPTRQVVVAYVGDQTWSWDGRDWIQAHPAVSPKHLFFESMAYDPAMGRVVLFGGKRDFVGSQPTIITNELWTWDGIPW